MRCVRCATPWPLTMRWPSPCGRRRRRNRPRRPRRNPQPPGRGRGCHVAWAKEAGSVRDVMGTSGDREPSAQLTDRAQRGNRMAGRLRRTHRAAAAARPDHRPDHRGRRTGADCPGAIAADRTVASPPPRRPATPRRLGCSLVDGRTAMDPAQALTGPDDAANTGEPDQPATNATTRPGQAETRSAPTPAGPGRGDGVSRPLHRRIPQRWGTDPRQTTYAGGGASGFIHPRVSRQ